VRLELGAGDAPTPVDLSTPSGTTFHLRACGVPPGEAEGMLVGVVEDAEDERPVGGAAVTVSWREWTVAKEGLEPTPRSLRVNADVAGRFALCSVPTDVVVGVSAAAAARSSGAVDVEIGRGLFAVRRLRVGAPGAAVVAGVVRDTSGKPVRGARALIAGTAAESTTDSLGGFYIGGAPAGSHVIEVRAVGYAPVRLPVLARAAAPARVEVVLGRTQVLPTIAVVGRNRPRVDVSGFEERRKVAAGYYMTQDQIVQRRAIVAMDLFRAVPGMMVQSTPDGGMRLLLTRGSADGCLPTVYLDGMVVQGGATQLNTLVRPHEIRGLEVYPSYVSVPNEFRAFNSNCGVVLVWTRTR
jgi:hypothetical protein